MKRYSATWWFLVQWAPGLAAFGIACWFLYQIRMLTRQVTVTQGALVVAIRERELAERALRTEQQGCDSLFRWYERCLDGRTCTEAEGETFKLWRHFDIPELPHMAITCDNARSKPAFREAHP